MAGHLRYSGLAPETKNLVVAGSLMFFVFGYTMRELLEVPMIFRLLSIYFLNSRAQIRFCPVNSWLLSATSLELLPPDLSFVLMKP